MKSVALVFLPRSGSTWLMSMLAELPGVFARFEILDTATSIRDGLASEQNHRLVGVEEQLAVIDRFLAEAALNRAAIAAFKFAPYQCLDPVRLFDHLRLRGVELVFVRRRNMVRAAVSQLAAIELTRREGQANATKDTRTVGALQLERDGFMDALHDIRREAGLLETFRQLNINRPHLLVDYEDLRQHTSAHVTSIARFLGLDLDLDAGGDEQRQLDAVRPNLRHRLAQSVLNFSDLRTWLAGSEYESCLADGAEESVRFVPLEHQPASQVALLHDHSQPTESAELAHQRAVAAMMEAAGSIVDSLRRAVQSEREGRAAERQAAQEQIQALTTWARSADAYGRSLLEERERHRRDAVLNLEALRESLQAAHAGMRMRDLALAEAAAQIVRLPHDGAEPAEPAAEPRLAHGVAINEPQDDREREAADLLALERDALRVEIHRLTDRHHGLTSRLEALLGEQDLTEDPRWEQLESLSAASTVMRARNIELEEHLRTAQAMMKSLRDQVEQCRDDRNAESRVMATRLAAAEHAAAQMAQSCEAAFDEVEQLRVALTAAHGSAATLQSQLDLARATADAVQKQAAAERMDATERQRRQERLIWALHERRAVLQARLASDTDASSPAPVADPQCPDRTDIGPRHSASLARSQDPMSTDEAWEAWGKKDPYFGVITHDRFRKDRLSDDARHEFFESGRVHVEYVVQTCRVRLSMSNFEPASVLDFGCGVGRLLVPFGRIARDVVGVDVAASMLTEARANCDRAGVEHVRLLPSDDELSAVDGQFDLVHSCIVLQHINPARGRHLFQRLVQKVRAGGAGALHVTYGWAGLDATFGQAPAVAEGAREPSGLRAWARNLVKAPRAVTAVQMSEPSQDPEMQMHAYALNELVYVLQRAGVTQMHVDTTDHGGALGVFLFFRMPTS